MKVIFKFVIILLLLLLNSINIVFANTNFSGIIDSGKSWCDNYSKRMKIPTKWHTNIGCVAIYGDEIHKVIYKNSAELVLYSDKNTKDIQNKLKE